MLNPFLVGLVLQQYPGRLGSVKLELVVEVPGGDYMECLLALLRFG